MRGIGPVAAALLIAGAGWAAGRPPPSVPADNPMSAAKVELGRRLFYDADLSADGSMACATCHVQRHAFADGNATHPGIGDSPGRRNVPGLANLAWAPVLTWADPRQRTLEAQMLVPFAGTHPVEMGMRGREGEAAVRLGRDACYVRMFRDAFPETGGRIDVDAVGKALAAFERSMVSDRSPWDRWRAGDAAALDAAAKRGAQVFARGCASCHAGPDFTDGRFHAAQHKEDDPGLGEVTGRPADMGHFRTPSLRNVMLTAPYLHDGSARTIGEAIDRHVGLTHAPTEEERAAIAAFLAALTDTAFVADPRFALPQTACGKPL